MFTTNALVRRNVILNIGFVVGSIVCFVLISSWSFAQEPEYFGIYSDQYPNPAVKLDKNVKLYVWENTGSLGKLNDQDSFKEEYTRFVYTNKKSWFGFGYAVMPGINFVDMSRFQNGYLSVTLKVKGDLPGSFRIGIKSGTSSRGDAWVTFSNYDLVHDGTWQTLHIPISDFVKANPYFLKLSQVSQYFMIDGKRNVPANNHE
jgi:hypothetical protein